MVFYLQLPAVLLIRCKEKQWQTIWFLVIFLLLLLTQISSMSTHLAKCLFFTRNLKNLKTKSISVLLNLFTFGFSFLIPIIVFGIYFAFKGAFPVFLNSALLQNFSYLSSWATGTQTASVSSGGLFGRLIVLLFF